MNERIKYFIKSTVNEPGVVKAWEEKILLPTYSVGEAEKNPMFLENRVYQGSSGVVYPYPVIEKINNEKNDQEYNVVFLENKYLKLMIMPELGGRVQMAYDKIRKRHFVYYNQVIKPALIGLLGPWISGGIEFNWPQHHRPSTFLPTESRIKENADGSVTVWCNEVERMFRMKGMQGFTLHPDKAYLEIKVKIYNRTNFPQTFLWWANPAVIVNDHYKSVFPPDVHAVFDHGKRDVSSFPIATGIYYKHDYSPGTDISRYKNIPVPTSYMAVLSKYDFIGGYEEDVKAGLLHVANHHISTGKKQWTWGNGDFGQAWDRNLTDEDGPYIELMTGVYTDNQPDFSWLQPYEEKSWSQYFMPYAEVDYVKNASKDIIANLYIEDEIVKVIIYTTSEFDHLKVVVKDNSNNLILEESIAGSPEKPIHLAAKCGKVGDLYLEISDCDNRTLLTYNTESETESEIPDPAKAVLSPDKIETLEGLYLAGLHLEQYRHATINPVIYYVEALRRDPEDIRSNNALGLYYLRRGRFEKSQPYFEQAVKSITRHNPNPYYGEPYYNLGCALKHQGKEKEAYAAYYKSTWNNDWQDAGYFSIAQIDIKNQNFELALEHIGKSLVKNWHNHKSRHLKTVVLRKLSRNEEALKWIEECLKIDLFNIGVIFEKHLIENDPEISKAIVDLLKDNIHTYIEYTFDYMNAGLYDEAKTFLSLVESSSYPMVHYILGYINMMSGENDIGIARYNKAEHLSPDRCFPSRIEEVIILEHVVKENPFASKAYYFLGNFWYANRQYKNAIECWEKSIEVNDTYPTALRNLALAYYNKSDRKVEARSLLEKAFFLDRTDSRVFMELDQLYKKSNVGPADRLRLYTEHKEVVENRDDLCVERAALYNILGEHKISASLISSRHFHPWEGGEGKITGQFVISRLGMALEAININEYDEALKLIEETNRFPANLGEGKLSTLQENDIEYFKGYIYTKLGDLVNAGKWLKKAAVGNQEPQPTFFYNDQGPDKIFYQGMALRLLGDENSAVQRFNKLIHYGQVHMDDNCEIDYFAVSLPDFAIWQDDLNRLNKIHCIYLLALGHLGLGDVTRAEQEFIKVLEMDVNHFHANWFLSKINHEIYGSALALEQYEEKS